ncbi:MAG: DUF1729 domain-containing protein, partial [Deltaproteobacteria bacterium]|nr:DUF1729 domain-containing protein [Deltaproteobacteria bacterium]
MLGNTNDARGAARTSDGKTTRGGDGRSLVPLAKALARGEARAVLSFAGQGIEWLPELAALARSEPWVRELCEAASVALEAWAAEREVSWSGLFAGGFSLASWLAGEAVSPQQLAATPVSMPGIFLTQVARFESLRRRGLGGAFEAGGIVATTGYSQGLAAATLVAECESGALAIPRVLEYLRVMAWLGFEVARATRDASSEPGSPMAVVVGPDAKAIDLALQGLDGLDGQGAWLALQNDRRRHVLSGTPRGLRIARERLEERAKREADARKAGRHGGAVMTVSWEEVATTAAFHSPLVLDGLERTLERVERAGFRVSPRLPVFDPGQTAGVGESTRSGLLLDPANASSEALATATRALVASIAVETGRWQRNLFGVLAHTNPTEQSVDVVLDLGPGEGVSRLTAGALRGTGVDSMALGGLGGEERERFFTAPRGPAPLRYDELMPRLAELPDGRVVVDNAFSRATGTPPIILPGMTPTTVDVPIVAAAANAGFTVELAGGGQVSDAVFQARMDELAEALEPGVEVAFNALLLDAYLWGLHLGDKRLVQKARAQGAPLSGVTVSAGIPSVDQAVALLDELAALGMRVNAFKPGTKSQIDEVIAIARAARHHRIFIHIEGGKAGGHHSWEDLDALLLDTYHLIRSQPNLVLCVGGGIADEARSTALLTGAWAERYGLPAMPVDAIFLGTLTMACREATATASVKTALARAQGTDRWVGRGQVQGGVTSGRSQLDADIHYLDNAAARCGRLLDEVAGNAAAVSARRDEIIEALAKTAKPYFGDFDAMTWPEVLERMVALMALGGVTPRYDDGPWLDVSWRARVFDVVRRAEARIAGASGTDDLVESVCPDPSALDAPAIVLAALSERYPLARTTRVHPADATWFLREVCARPGKPVPFVPVIDQDVRRWYKSDSLWQAQHPRFDGDQVLVIPGPEAVMGITREDEPVAELLGRFDRALVASLVARGEVPRRLDALEGAAA